MLKDMGEIKLVKETVENARQVTTFIYNHGYALEMMRTKCGGDLVRPGLTRFATNYIALKSFEMKKSGLRLMFASEKWFEWPMSSSRAGRTAQATISSDKFWDDVKKVVAILDPIVKVLRMVDGQRKATLPHLWAAIEMMKMQVEEAYRRNSKYIAIIKDRWERQLKHPLHKAGESLLDVLQFLN